MELKKAWEEIYKILSDNDINEPSDIDWIFCEVLKLNRAELKIRKEISLAEYNKIISIAKERAKNIPLQRIFGKANFWGLDFFINDDTLIPRFDTEILVEQALKYINKLGNNHLKILDLCTGSGCIAVTIAKFSNSLVWASDINKNAIEIARKNAKNHNVKINFVLSNMFDNINEKFDIIISNPPYIKSMDIKLLEPTVKNYEPILALDGGDDGLKYYNIIVNNAKEHLSKNGVLLLEIGYNQAKSVANILKTCYNDIQVVKDLQGNDRVIIASVN